MGQSAHDSAYHRCRLAIFKIQRNSTRTQSLRDRPQIGASTRLRMDRILICGGYKMVCVDRQMAIDTAVETEVEKT
jgi:hypothetical protein